MTTPHLNYSLYDHYTKYFNQFESNLKSSQQQNYSQQQNSIQHQHYDNIQGQYQIYQDYMQNQKAKHQYFYGKDYYGYEYSPTRIEESMITKNNIRSIIQDELKPLTHQVHILTTDFQKLTQENKYYRDKNLKIEEILSKMIDVLDNLPNEIKNQSSVKSLVSSGEKLLEEEEEREI